jgi:hypothetical protein
MTQPSDSTPIDNAPIEPTPINPIPNEVPPPPAGPRLWNPNAAALWGLLLSPVFSAVLHLMNWQALGEAEKAHEAKQWVIALVAVMLGSTLVLVFWPESQLLDTLSRAVGVALLVAWYYGAGKATARARHRRRAWPRCMAAATRAVAGSRRC